MARKPAAVKADRKPAKKKPKATGLGTPGAIESNAGDDYHILWACRRCLCLLEPDAALTLVTVEGVSSRDEAATPDPDAFLGVDLTEYYGGMSFQDARQVVFSQLKYSQRHPERSWTAARLCETPTGPRSRSVIARLAQAFTGLSSKNPRLLIIERLRIKLVSNRPLDASLAESLKAAREWLDGIDPKTSSKATQLINGIQGILERSYKDLKDEQIKPLIESHKADIQRLQQSSRLASADFCDFLRCLDFSDCDSDSRRWQRLRLIEELGSIAASPAERLRELYELVAAEALPKTMTRGLGRSDILATLGCHSENDLYPTPPRFQRLADPISTSDAGRIVAALRESAERRLLVHGAGGVGKTTAVLSLQESWQDPKILYYDCFGGGTYKDSPGDERHSPRRALLQLSNQLAVQCGSPFLIRPPSQIDDLWRRFRDRLDIAADLLKSQGESLVLVIDAADNAIHAADTPEDSFVPHLWKIPLPDNVYLVMTARSGGRAQSLQAPVGVSQVELAGFDADASAQHLRRCFATANADQVQVFHERSHGNPRVQNYALQSSAESPDMEAVLDRARRKLEDIFQDYVEAAETLRFSHGKAADHLDDLVCFPRPLRLADLCEVLALPNGEIEALSGALHPGLSPQQEGWGFRDEDFETFLRSRLEPERERAAHRRLAQRMAELPDSDFAARHLARHLFQAGDDEGVIGLALEGDAPIPIRDQVAKVQVLRRRLSLGVKAAVRAKRPEALVRLAVHAADAARSDRAILKLVEDYPDLAALYADPQTIAKHYLDAQHQGWFGGAQLRCAALFSRNPEHHARARDHLDMAEAWIRRWMVKPDDERQHWRVENREIAAGAEAVFRLFGPEAATRWLQRWRPMDAVLRATHCLAETIAPDIPTARQGELYRSLHLHPLAAVLFLVAFQRRGQPPERWLVEAAAKSVDGYSRLYRRRFLRRESYLSEEEQSFHAALGIEFCELLAVQGLPAEWIARLAERTCPVEAGFVPRDGFDANRFDPQLRILALLAELIGKEPDEEELKQRLIQYHESDSEHERGGAQRRFSDLIIPRFRLYRLRAEAQVRRPSAADLLPRLQETLAKGGGELWRYGRDFDFYYRDAAPLAVETVLLCQGSVDAFLDSITEEILRRFKQGAPWRWIDLAKRLIAVPAYRRRALALLDQAANQLATHPTDNQEHCEALLRSAALAQPYDPAMGAELFRRAVVVARELNDDLCDRLAYLAQTVEGLRGTLDEAESQAVAARLARLTEATRAYVSEGDRYPWETVFRAVMGIHPPSGFALFTRWDDLDHFDIRGHVDDLARAGLAFGILSPARALALLRLGWDSGATAYAFQPVLAAALENGSTRTLAFRGLVKTVTTWVLRDLSLKARPDGAREVQSWLAEHGCGDLVEGQALREYLTFVADHPTRDETLSDYGGHRIGENGDERFDWDVFFAKHVGTASIPERLPQLIQALRETHNSYNHRSELYWQIRQRLLSYEFPAYLQALLELPSERVYSDEFLGEWETCLNNWHHLPAVVEWAEAGMAELARRHLPTLLGYHFNADKMLQRFLQLPFVKPERWLDLLGPALAEWVERLEAWSLYLIAGVLSRGFTVKQRHELLLDALIQGEQAIALRQHQPLSPLPAWELYGDDLDRPLAMFLYTLCGHPDTRIRWSCLHALRAMDMQNDPVLLAALVGRLDTQDAGGFLPTDTPFFWMSARAYLLLFLARFAQEHPQALLPHLQILIDHALTKDFPHAQIRELAKWAVLAVADQVPVALDADIRQQVEAANRPLEVVIAKGDKRFLGWNDRNHEGRFKFNSMDTLPYWFAPLGRRFGLDAYAIATLAEKWICDEWGFRGYEARKHHSARCKRRDRDWHLTNNDHGSFPIIEELQLYLEYHALHLVAGGLVDSQPLKLEHPDWVCDRWEGWMENHLPTRRHEWLSELRDQTPLEAPLQGRFAPLEHWLTPAMPKDFDACLGLDGTGPVEHLIVAAQVDICGWSRREHHRVESALVTLEFAHTLLRELQSIGDPHLYRIPPAGDDLEIGEPGFELKGWIDYHSGEKELDGRDPLLHGMDTGMPVFPASVQEALGVMPDSTGKRYFDLNAPDRVVAETKVWSDQPDPSDHAEFSDGWRLKIDIRRLLRFLVELRSCLILEVQIDREKRRHGENHYEYKPPPVLLYLLHPDGRLESLEHHHRLGAEDR